VWSETAGTGYPMMALRFARELIDIWTILPASAYERLLRDGALRGRWDLVDPDSVSAYRWMSDAMEARGLALSGRPPLWAWYAYDGLKRRRPDLRCTGHLPAGTRGVRLALRVAAAESLLSNFQMWHGVLNKRYLAASAADEARFEQTDGARADEMLRRSWEAIFDLDFGDDQYWGPKCTRQIQVCLARLAVGDVRRVDAFVAR
jgi:hypothetical protein